MFSQDIKEEGIVESNHYSNADVYSCDAIHERQLDESLLLTLTEYPKHIKGKYKCCHCAYNSGYQQGALLQNFIGLDVDSLGDIDKDATSTFKSIHQAFALGYSDGVKDYLK